jgi:hypothetical protein
MVFEWRKLVHRIKSFEKKPKKLPYLKNPSFPTKSFKLAYLGQCVEIKKYMRFTFKNSILSDDQTV